MKIAVNLQKLFRQKKISCQKFSPFEQIKKALLFPIIKKREKSESS
jgi:hypothetical protein